MVSFIVFRLVRYSPTIHVTAGYLTKHRSRDSVIGSYWLDGQGFVPLYGQNILFSLKPIRLLFYKYRGSHPGSKRPGREVNHSSPPIAKVNNEDSYTSAPPICHYGVDRKTLPFNAQTIHVFSTTHEVLGTIYKRIFLRTFSSVYTCSYRNESLLSTI